MNSDQIIKLQTKPIEEMDRWEVINALRSYVPNQLYQSIFNWNTDRMKTLLAYYRCHE